jgi:hypothetical protein
MGTKNNPGAFDCYEAAHPDEPMFVLLGRDRLAASLVRLWAYMRRATGEDSTKVAEALTCADAMADWARGLGKSPDVFPSRVCGECHHFFDPTDKRSFRPSRAAADMEPLCPLCAQFLLHGREAWAVWNDCNGIFSDTVRATKTEVEELMKPGPMSYGGVGCEAVPVRVLLEPDDRRDIREHFEATARAKGKCST